jgi:fumarate reductase subunit D
MTRVSLGRRLSRPLFTNLEPYVRTGGPITVYTAAMLAGAVVLFPLGLATGAAVDPAALTGWSRGPALFLAVTLIVMVILMLPHALGGLHRAARDAHVATMAVATAGAGAVTLWIAAAPVWTVYMRGQWLAPGGDPIMDARLVGTFEGLVDLAPLGLALFWAGVSMLCEAVLGRSGRDGVLARILAFAAGIAAIGPFVATTTPVGARALMLAGCVALAVLGVRVTAGARAAGPAGD